MAAPQRHFLWAITLIAADQFLTLFAMRLNVAHAATHRVVALPFLASFLLATIIFIALWRYFQKTPIAIMLISAGFLSNVLTLVTRHTIYDYIPTGISYTNAADLLISVGCGILVVELWRSTFRRPV